MRLCNGLKRNMQEKSACSLKWDGWTMIRMPMKYLFRLTLTLFLLISLMLSMVRNTRLATTRLSRRWLRWPQSVIRSIPKTKLLSLRNLLTESPTVSVSWLYSRSHVAIM